MQWSSIGSGRKLVAWNLRKGGGWSKLSKYVKGRKKSANSEIGPGGSLTIQYQ